MIDVIIPSFNDYRIFRTIDSLRACPEYKLLRLIVIDGGSKIELQSRIKLSLRTHDILIAEKDKGIFDALNKGLKSSDNMFVYWLGSDDFLSPDFSFAQALDLFSHDINLGCVCYKTIFFNSSGSTRSIFPLRPSRASYIWGSHLPHFSTIWRRSVLDGVEFDLRYSIASDYDFFFKVFLLKEFRIASFPSVMVFMEEGGNSTRSFSQRLKSLKQNYSIHHSHTGSVFISLVALLRRYFYKAVNRVEFMLYKSYSVTTPLTRIIVSKSNSENEN